jgi:hypothetical protein
MNLEQARNCGRFIGRGELIAHLEGTKLAKWRAAKAKCFECMGGYADGGYDCLIPTCPLYPWMPYRGQEPHGASGDSTGLGASKVSHEEHNKVPDNQDNQ